MQKWREKNGEGFYRGTEMFGIFGAFIGPEMLAEAKRLQGGAFAITGVTKKGDPELIGVLLSGGLDSTVLAYSLQRDGCELKALTVLYGQRHAREAEAARAIASALAVEHRVADLTNPILKPWVIDQMKKTNDAVLAGKVPFIARERCWPAGVPGLDIYNRGQPVHFLQTLKEVLIVNELYASTRHVYMDVPHSTNPKTSWYGESVGHYEADELVVDTVGLNDRTFVDNYRTPHTTQLHVIEHFKMINGGKTLQVLVRIDDPGAFNMPWNAKQTWVRVHPGALIEDICEPNNDFYFGYDVAPLPHEDRPSF